MPYRAAGLVLAGAAVGLAVGFTFGEWFEDHISRAVAGSWH